MAELNHPMKYRMLHLVRLLTFMPEDDLALIVLKGHLAIEEQLILLIERKLSYPDALDKARLTFFQQVCLAKAMYYKPENMWIWTSLEKLNQVRNHLSHTLEASRLETKATEFTGSIKGFSEPDSTIEEQMRHALVFMCGSLTEVADENSSAQ